MSVIVDGYDTKKCKGCVYWRRFAAGQDQYACHYMIDTEKRAERRDGKCFSRKIKKQ